jgi:glycosyltransferase involved in cell wall biosynthesis
MRSADIFGPFTGPTGYDNIVRGFVRGIANRGVQVALRNFDQWSGFKIAIDPLFEKLPKPSGGPKVHLSFCLPPQAVYSDNQFSALYTMFEGTCVSLEWAQMASSFDLVIAPCQSSLDAFRMAGVRNSILAKVPIGIDTKMYNPSVKPLGLIDDHFGALSRYKIRVMNIQELGPRKNLEGLLEAWVVGTSMGAMKTESCLILKLSAYSPNRYNKIYSNLKAIRDKFCLKKGDHAPIFVSCRMFDDTEMPAYMAQCTHYISMSKGEGWDLPAIQAAALGKHVIVPFHSSYLEWGKTSGFAELNEPTWINSLKTEKSEADGALKDIYSRSEWFVPSSDEAANIIRNLHNDKHVEDTPLGERVRKQYSWEAVSDQMIELLDNRAWKHEFGTVRESIAESYQAEIRNGKNIPKIISFWTQNLNKPCGIADYTTKIASAMMKKSKNIGVIGGSIRAHDMMVGMNRYALENIEFEYQFASPRRIALTLQTLRERGIKSVVTMHTFSTNTEQHNKNIFKYADKIFVHNLATVEAMKKEWLPTENVVIAPMPFPALMTQEELSKTDYLKINSSGKYVIGFYGFLYFHKGLEKLIDAFAELRKTTKNSMLLIVASKPQNTNDDVAGRALEKLKKHGFEAGTDYVWVSDFIADERKAIATLSQSDLIALPYDDYGSFGASAAVNSVLATGKPVIVSDTVWFDHVPNDVAFKLSDKNLIDALRIELSEKDEEFISNWKNRIADFVNEHSAEKVAEWHFKQYSQLLGTLP